MTFLSLLTSFKPIFLRGKYAHRTPEFLHNLLKLIFHENAAGIPLILLGLDMNTNSYFVQNYYHHHNKFQTLFGSVT